MKLFNTAAIVGVGLIGGSLGLALKENGLCKKVIGVSRHTKTLRLAHARGVIDAGSQDFSILQQADLVIIAAPVEKILHLAGKISRFISKECIVIDVGSTKAEIVAALDKIFPKYLGTHPLAGSEKRGVSNAAPDLFKNSMCILTPTQKTKVDVIHKIKSMWEALGSRLVYLTAQKHDRIISFTSHLPHVSAFSLMLSVPDRCFPCAASGLRDTTRIAASDEVLWTDIFLSNQTNILEAITVFQENIAGIKTAIRRSDRRALLRILRKAKQKREHL